MPSSASNASCTRHRAWSWRSFRSGSRPVPGTRRIGSAQRIQVVTEIGDTENISKSYVSRILRLALLAPDVVEDILAGTADHALVLERLKRPLPPRWEEQRRLLGRAS